MNLLPEEIVHRIFDNIEALEHAQNNLQDAFDREVDTLEDRILAEAQAWRTVRGSNREQRTAFVREACVKEIIANEKAEREAKLHLKVVDGKRQSLSALQSASKGVVEESQHARVGPDYDPRVGDERGLEDRMEAERARTGGGFTRN